MSTQDSVLLYIAVLLFGVAFLIICCCACGIYCVNQEQRRSLLRQYGPGPDVSHAAMELDVVLQNDNNRGIQSDNSSNSQGNGNGTNSRLQEPVFRLHGVFSRDIY